jgi:hypothetical protein
MPYRYKPNGMPGTTDRNTEQTRSVIRDLDNEQSKVVPVPKHHNMKKYGGIEVNLTAFLIQVLDGGGWSDSSPVSLTMASIEEQAVHCPELICRWGRREHSFPLRGIKPLSSRPQPATLLTEL